MNGKAHAIFGAGAGIGTGVALSLSANRQPTIPEVCGWITGGVTGAKLPDLFEPAIHPHHRGFGHSGSLLAANLSFLTSETLSSWIESLKSAAAGYRLEAQLDPQSALLHSLVACLLEFWLAHCRQCLAATRRIWFVMPRPHLVSRSVNPRFELQFGEAS